MGKQTNKKSNMNPNMLICDNINVYYEEPEELKNSIRSQEYFDAFEVIRKIEKCTKNNWINGGGSGTRQRNREQILNVVFFTGERGAGKTSAMLSFMEFLKDYYRNSSKNPSDMPEEFQLDKMQSYMFTGIDCIDASALNEKDDLLGSVLSNMLTKWNKEEERSSSNSGIYRGRDYDYNKRDLQLHFSKLYDRLKNLRSKSDVMEKDSDVFLETLEQLSLSQNVKTSFKELVESYLKIMTYPQSRDTIGEANHFLVIPIDDLDMNINYGFMLLEQVRKFLMLPNVIVLLSANYEQLEKICCNHYAKEFDKLEKTDYNNEYIVRLAREYLDKIVPKQNQVKLSSGYKWKYFLDKQITLQYKPMTVGKAETKEGTLCKIIEEYMQEYFGLHLQPSGICLRYLTPGTFRDLTSMVIRIHSLQKLSSQGTISKRIEHYQDNSSYFLDEILVNVSRKYLLRDNQNIVKNLEILEPGEEISFLAKTLEYKKPYEDSLLGILHFKLEEAKNEEQQALAVICILYFTIKLTKYTMQLKNSDNNKEMSERNRRLLMGYYTNKSWGLWGSWETKILQPVWDNNEKDIKCISNITFTPKQECLNIELKDENAIGTFIEANKEQLVNYQYMLLFFDLGIQKHKEKLWKKEENGKMVIRCNGSFALSGFILNLLNGAENVCLFNRDFSTEYGLELQSEGISILPEIEEYLYKPLLPLENIEYIYSLGQRLETEMKSYENESFGSMIKHFFILFLEIIEELDAEYDFKYHENMKNNPLVKRVLENEGFITFLENQLNGLLEKLFDHIEKIKWNGII